MKGTEPKVSVIIPVYNAEKYIECLTDSLLKQTYKNMEIIMVENLSADNSLALCRSMEQEHTQIRVIQEEQKGAGNARNRGMKEAGGDYIFFADADDYLSDMTLIETMVKLLEKSGADIAVCNYARLWNEKILPAASHSEFSRLHRNSQDFRFRGFFSAGNLAYVWGKLYRRSFLREHNIRFAEYRYGEDKLFNMQCYLCEACYCFVENEGYIYRNNEQSVMHQTTFDFSKCWMTIAAELQDWMAEQQISPECEDMIAYLILFGAFFDAKSGYEAKKKSLFAIWKILRFYGKNPLAHRYFREMSRGKCQQGLTQKLWKVMLRGFSTGMKCHMYLALACGIRFLIRHRIDERLSDTGLREEK